MKIFLLSFLSEDLIEYEIIGEGSQILTNQKQESTVFSLLIGRNLRHFPDNFVLYITANFNDHFERFSVWKPAHMLRLRGGRMKDEGETKMGEGQPRTETNSSVFSWVLVTVH